MKFVRFYSGRRKFAPFYINVEYDIIRYGGHYPLYYRHTSEFIESEVAVADQKVHEVEIYLTLGSCNPGPKVYGQPGYPGPSAAEVAMRSMYFHLR